MIIIELSFESEGKKSNLKVINRFFIGDGFMAKESYIGPVISLGIDDISKATGIGKTQWYKYCNIGLLPYLQLGTKKIIIRTVVVNEFLKVNEGRDLMDVDNLKPVIECTI